MLNVQKHLALLGKRVEDRVTGFKGVVASMSFDLYGCVQAIVNPGIGPDGKLGESAWLDVTRLKVTDPEPVMPAPDFTFDIDSPQGRAAIAGGRKGPAERPRSMKP